jgi:hypothetical protein
VFKSLRGNSNKTLESGVGGTGLRHQISQEGKCDLTFFQKLHLGNFACLKHTVVFYSKYLCNVTSREGGGRQSRQMAQGGGGLKLDNKCRVFFEWPRIY